MLIPYNDDDLKMLAKTGWGEARGEPELGQIAVFWTAVNRATLPIYTFAGPFVGKEGALSRVCKMPYQFSCWNRNDPNRPKLDALQEKDYAYQLDLAKQVLEGSIPDPTDGATYYCASYLGYPSGWPQGARRLSLSVEIGRQSFYIDPYEPAVKLEVINDQ